MLHHQLKHLERRQKYSAARRIFNSLIDVASGDETLRLMLDLLLLLLFLYKVLCPAAENDPLISTGKLPLSYHSDHLRSVPFILLR